MFSVFEREVLALINELLAKKKVDLIPQFSIPSVERFGDLSTNVCFQLAPIFKKSPSDIAVQLADELKPSGLVKAVRAEKGYLNFYIDYPAYTKMLLEAMSSDFGHGESKPEKVFLEHTSANPDGPLHIGHLRNAVIGDTLVRILRFAGYKVEVHYYLNDMGKQVSKVVWGRRRYALPKGKKDTATAHVYIKANKEIEEQGCEDDLSELLSLYETGDKGVVEEFERAVNYCLEGIQETLGRLGIKHDKFLWESTFVRSGSVAKVIDNLSESRFAEQDEGALYIDLKTFGIEKEMYITRGDGTSLYIARDLAHHAYKMDQGVGINVWGADHKLVAQQLSAGLDILGFNAPEFIIHEFISLPQGSMSTRKGIYISADELIDETVKQAFEEVKTRRAELSVLKAQRIAEYVGVSAVRFNIERIAPEKSMVFRWDEALDFERQGAPFIQYAYARSKKILDKSTTVPEIDKVPELEKAEKKLIKSISMFPQTVESAANSRKVSIIANYTISLSNNFHSFYMSSKVIGSEKQSLRLALVKAFFITVGNAMDLLGIIRLDEM